LRKDESDREDLVLVLCGLGADLAESGRYRAYRIVLKQFISIGGYPQEHKTL